MCATSISSHMKHIKRSYHMVSYAQCNACRPVDLFAHSLVRRFQNQSIPPTPVGQEHAVNSINMLQRLSSCWMCICHRTVGISLRCATWQCSSQRRPPHGEVVSSRPGDRLCHRTETQSVPFVVGPFELFAGVPLTAPPASFSTSFRTILLTFSPLTPFMGQ